MRRKLRRALAYLSALRMPAIVTWNRTPREHRAS